MTRLRELVDARVLAVRVHAAAVEAWHHAKDSEKRARLLEMHEAMQADARSRIALDDAIAIAARTP